MSTWDRLDRDLVRRALASPALGNLAPATRQAAVAVALNDGATGVELLLIRRAERASDPWSGHMALPGGHAESMDENLLSTVVRETREELGIDLSRDAEYLGHLEDFEPVSNTSLSVRPFVFALDGSPQVRPNAEVAEALWLSVAELVSGALAAEHELVLGEQRLRFPAYRAGDRRVWGLTYRVLATLFSRVTSAELAMAKPLLESSR
jgi:8-oxo-dGTP pyrophosphatase MutT (NUDIX family)